MKKGKKYVERKNRKKCKNRSFTGFIWSGKNCVFKDSQEIFLKLEESPVKSGDFFET